MNLPGVISFEAPSPFTAVTFTADGILLAGGDDGSIRVYDLSPTAQRALRKAVQGLPHEVASICSQSTGSTGALGRCWAASGKQVFLFDLDSDQLVIKKEKAESIVTLIEESEGGEDNVLNQISLYKDSIAYSCDSGVVGVLDIQTKNRKVMKAAHTNICGSVVFVPIRQREVISGGYDSQLIHFDTDLGTVLSRIDIPGPGTTNDGPISLSPPFILSIAVDSDGVLAAATADGRIIIGRGGEKRTGESRPNKRKWNGLNKNMIHAYHIAEGPVVAISWVGPSELLTVSLGGELKHVRITDIPREGRSVSTHTQVQELWREQTKQVHKVNGLAVFANPERVLSIAIAGFSTTGRGCVEVWKRRMGDGLVV